jgi:hypothetical protein
MVQQGQLYVHQAFARLDISGNEIITAYVLLGVFA